MTSVFKELTLDLEKTERLDKVLTATLGISRSTIQSWLKAGLVSVNGEVVKSNYKAQNGDVVTILQKEEEATTIQPEDIPLDIVFEDDSLIVVNKPSGMVVHPSKGHYSGTLVNALYIIQIVYQIAKVKKFTVQVLFTALIRIQVDY